LFWGWLASVARKNSNECGDVKRTAFIVRIEQRQKVGFKRKKNDVKKGRT
jgi:hypothetical protein